MQSASTLSAIVACAFLAGCAAGHHAAPPAADAVPHFTCVRLEGMGGSPFGIGTGDWNGDGQPDLVISSAELGGVTPYLNAGQRRFTPQPIVHAGELSRHIAVADINGDGHLDLAVANAESHNVAILIGDGNGGFQNNKQYRTGISPFDVAFADFDGDGRLDLVIVNESNAAISGNTGFVSVLFGQEDGFSQPVQLTAGDRPSAVAVAELNGQPGLDLAVTNWKSNTVSIFLNSGARTFRHSDEIAYGGGIPYGPGRPYSVAAGDFDQDGATDLAVTDLSTNTVVILFGDGHGAFPRHASYKAGNGVRHVVSVDLNGDGVLDLVTANTSGDSVSMLMGQRGGTFAPAQQFPVGRGPRVVHAVDLDGDGKPDLVVTNAAAGTVSLLFQTDGDSRWCPQ